MSYAGLPAGFSVAEQSKPAAYHGLPEGFEVQKQDGHSWGGALLSAPGAALGEIGGAVTGAGRFLASLPEDPLGYKIGRALKAAPGAIRDDLAGMSQYVRNLSAPQYRGRAPTFAGGEAESHPWLALTQGDTDPMKQAVATRPLALAGDAAMAAGMTAPGRAVMGMMSDAAMAGPRKVGRALADLTPANRAENALHHAASQSSSPNTIAALLENKKPPVPSVGYSAAQATQDPGMAQLEKSSRINQGPAWAQFDTGQNTGLFNALRGLVAPATDEAVGTARTARAEATRGLREEALDRADTIHGPERTAAPIRDMVSELMAGSQGSVPGMNKVSDYTLSNIARGDAPAAATYEVRTTLADALNRKAGISLSDLESSVKSAAAGTRAIKTSIDQALNEASGGMWARYLSDFAANSKNVNSVEALSGIRADLEKKIEGGAVDGNGNPKLTRAYLKQVIERHSTNKYGDTILPGPQGELDKILATAQQLEAPQANYRMAATGGGGSDTVSNLALSHLVRKAGPMGRIASAVISGLGEEGGATRLAALLQNPVDAANAIRTAAAREAARKVKSTGVKPAVLAAILSAQPQQ